MKKLLILSLIFLTSCGQVAEPPELPLLPLLQGTWRSCQNDNTTSMLIIFTFSNNQLSETISQWDQHNCTGNETIYIQFNALVVAETNEGKSKYLTGASDLSFSPDVDLFGCGIGVPAYTIIKFTSKTYNSFNPGSTQPTCTSSGRDTAINSSMTFIKQ